MKIELPEDGDIMKLLYERGFNSENIAALYATGRGTVCNILETTGVDRRSNSEAQRKYPIQEEYFDEINTAEKAYFLGLIFADGSVRKIGENSGKIKLSLQEGDYKTVAAFSKAIYGVDRSRVYTGSNGGGPMVEVVFSSARLAQSVLATGRTNLKRDILGVPQESILPRVLLGDFVRGVFDGDGHISQHRWTVGSKRANVTFTHNLQFLESLKDALGIPGGNIYKKRNTLSGSLVYSSHVGAAQLAALMYPPGEYPTMERKKQVFDELIAHIARSHNKK